MVQHSKKWRAVSSLLFIFSRTVLTRCAVPFLPPNLKAQSFYVASRVGEPIVELSRRHPGLVRELLLLLFGGVRVVWMVFYPLD